MLGRSALLRPSARLQPGGRKCVLGFSRGLAAKKLVGSLDQGTTSTRFILFDEHARSVASHQMEHKQFYPRDGWCEHDPLEIFDNAVECIDAAVAKLADQGYSASDVVAVGITNQRETTVVWDKHTGQPLHNAVVWLDLRTAELAKELSQQGERRAWAWPASRAPPQRGRWPLRVCACRVCLVWVGRRGVWGGRVLSFQWPSSHGVCQCAPSYPCATPAHSHPPPVSC